MKRIVIGVDGSPGAAAALDWGLSEARLRDASVDVVHAYHSPVSGELPPGGEVSDEMAAAATGVVDEALATVDASGVDVRRRVEHGPAAAVLVAAASGADLLVLGSRGRGGFAGLLLGSVSQQCTHHAPCPVVIVRSPRDT
jgi:nucleotide-binding universal stress UspA family protein